MGRPRPSCRGQAVAATALAAGTGWLAWTAPWLQARADGGGWTDVTRKVLMASSPNGFEQWLLQAPLVALLAMVAAAVAWAWGPGPARRWPLLVAAAAGFGLVHVSCTWIGFASAQALVPGPAFVRLHVVPWALLATGTIVAAGSLRLLAGDPGHAVQPPAPAGPSARLLAGIHAAALLLGVLAPLARTPLPPGHYYYDELTLHALAPPSVTLPLVGVRLLAMFGLAWAVLAGRWQPRVQAATFAGALGVHAWLAVALGRWTPSIELGPNLSGPVLAIAALVYLGVRRRGLGSRP